MFTEYLGFVSDKERNYREENYREVLLRCLDSKTVYECQLVLFPFLKSAGPAVLTNGCKVRPVKTSKCLFQLSSVQFV